jgi:outer membrane lipoprotein-sorting protein
MTFMRSVFLPAVLLVSAYSQAFAAHKGPAKIAPPIDPDAIVRKADEGRGPQMQFSFTAKVTNLSGSDSQVNTYRVFSNQMEASLVEQTEPQRLVGRKLLMKGHDLWLYTPGIHRPTRISFEQRLTGEVSNGDLARTNFSGDYSAVLKKTESIEGKSCLKLHLTANAKDVTYREADYWVEKDTYLPRMAMFYAISGKLLKSAVYSDFKPIMGHLRMTKIVIKDALQPSKQSIMEYSDQRKEHFKDGFFNKESLGQ